MLNSIRTFLSSESGATTVDFVVGAAAGIMLALAVTAVISDGTTQMSENVSDELEGMEVISEL